VCAELSRRIEGVIRREVLNLDNSQNAVLRRQNQIMDKIISVTDETLLEKLKNEFSRTTARLEEINQLKSIKQKELNSSKNRINIYRRKMLSLSHNDLLKNREAFSLIVKRFINRIEIGDDITIELI
jgi:hypothetical protein